MRRHTRGGAQGAGPCISRVARVWNKTESALKGDARFYNSQHVKRVKAARKDDELIRSLAHLREVDEHSHEETTAEMPAGFVNISTDGSVWARNPRGTICGVTMNVTPPPSFVRKIVGAELRARSVTSRGKTYDIPSQHQGNNIFAAPLVELAERGLRFCRSFIDDLAAEGWDA
ncbi:hypothetical protein P3T20_005100 [Paraburkholderia sp. GAS206C]|uniref:hypothetical protein n=1 Tax=Paraburkholderia sp. GAS206C TaxID=3035128 RepID=UPI003D25D1DA